MTDEELAGIYQERERLAKERRKRLADDMLAILQKLDSTSMPEDIRAWSLKTRSDVLNGTLPLRSSY